MTINKELQTIREEFDDEVEEMQVGTQVNPRLLDERKVFAFFEKTIRRLLEEQAKISLDTADKLFMAGYKYAHIPPPDRIPSESKWNLIYDILDTDGITDTQGKEDEGFVIDDRPQSMTKENALKLKKALEKEGLDVVLYSEVKNKKL